MADDFSYVGDAEIRSRLGAVKALDDAVANYQRVYGFPGLVEALSGHLKQAANDEHENRLDAIKAKRRARG